VSKSASHLHWDASGAQGPPWHTATSCVERSSSIPLNEEGRLVLWPERAARREVDRPMRGDRGGFSDAIVTAERRLFQSRGAVTGKAGAGGHAETGASSPEAQSSLAGLCASGQLTRIPVRNAGIVHRRLTVGFLIKGGSTPTWCGPGRVPDRQPG